jgi:hypothetical protein
VPSCRVEELTDYVCDDAHASLGQLALRAGTDLTVCADATGSADDSAKILEPIYGAELVWRVALHEPLPTDIGDALHETAEKAAEQDMDLWNVQAPLLGPLHAFYRIGQAIKSGDLLGGADAIKDAPSDDVIRGWIVGRWPNLQDALPVVGQSIDAVELGVAVGELPVTWAIEFIPGVGAPFGTIDLTVPGPIVADGEFVKDSGPLHLPDRESDETTRA